MVAIKRSVGRMLSFLPKISVKVDKIKTAIIVGHGRVIFKVRVMLI